MKVFVIQGEGIIIKNNKTVGKHCLSFLFNFYGNQKKELVWRKHKNII